MKRLLPAVLLVLAGTAALPVRAEDPPYREFVQGLRDRHYADLAIEYLQELAKKKNLPADFAAILPLEMARTRLAQADEAANAGQRTALYAQARADFTTYLKGNPPPDLAAEANLELAKILRLQAKAQLSLARQQEDPDQAKAEKAKARTQFEQAGKALQQAAAQIAAQLARHPDPKTAAEKQQRQALAGARREAEFEQALTLFDTLQTFEDVAAKRGELAQKAMEMFAKLAGKDNGERDALAWKARVWAGRCALEIDNPVAARNAYAEVVADTSPQAEDARRLARYFQMLLIERDPQTRKDPLADVVRSGERWLETYRAERNTPEGYGVRFTMAEALRGEAAKLPKGSGLAREYYGRAEKIYGLLERSDNDYTEQARQRRQEILITQLAAESRGPIEQLKDFPQCFMRARIEFAQAGKEQRDFAKKTPGAAKEAEEARKKLNADLHKHYRDAITALNRGLELADDKAEPGDLTEARFLLACAYFYADRPYEAAVAGEDLARREPQANRAPAAAVYALEAYSRVVGGEHGDDDHRQKLIDADEAHMGRLARYIIAKWPTDPNADFARHVLGSLSMKQKKYAEAVALLSQIRPSYSAFTSSQFDLSTAILQAAKQSATAGTPGQPRPGKPSAKQQAIAALEKVPPLPADASPSTAQYYFIGRLRLCFFLLDEERYAEMQAVAQKTDKEFAAAHLPESVRGQLKAAVNALPVYARFGEAKLAGNAGKWAEVKKQTDPFVKQLRDKQLQDFKDPRLVLLTLELALRADLELGDQARAKAALDLLLSKGAAGDIEGGATGVLTLLAKDLKDEVDRLRKEGQPAEERLQKLVANFSAFLDELAKQPPQTLTPDMLRFLASCYSALGKHTEAADLLARYPKPAPSTNPDEDKRKREDDERQALYHAVRLLYARELRLAKQFDQAAAVLKERAATRLGQRSLETKKEQASLLEDEGKFVPAAQSWGKLMRDLKPKLSDNVYREQYFECYYHFVVCYYRHSQTLTNPARKANAVQKAAQYIIGVEEKYPNMGKDGLKEKYLELLRQEAPLRSAYEQAGGTLLKGAGAPSARQD